MKLHQSEVETSRKKSMINILNMEQAFQSFSDITSKGYNLNSSLSLVLKNLNIGFHW